MYSHNLFGGSPEKMENVTKLSVVSISVSSELISPRPSRECSDRVRESGTGKSVSLIDI